MFFPVYFSLRGPVITHQIDDKVTWFQCFDTRTDFENAANALGSKRGREIEADHARKRGLPGKVEIARDRCRVQATHGEVGVVGFYDHHLAATRDAERGDQAMSPARERSERPRGLVEINRFVQNPTFDNERLIRPQTIGVRSQRARDTRFFLGQPRSKILERASAREMVPFQRPFVDIRRHDLRV